MIIQHNIMAMSAYRNYMGNTNALSKNLEKLSSGYRINRAGDDAAGLAISEKMRAQITGLDAAQKNVQDGISLVQTAEGALQEVQDMLNRMVYLATQSANGTYDNEVDRANLQKEVDALSTEIDRIADSSNFNGIKLLDGSLGMNTDAISVATKGAVEATDGTIALGELFSGFHAEGDAKTGVFGKASVDFDGISITHSGYTAAADSDLKINIGDKSIQVDLTAYNTAVKSYADGAALASELATAIYKGDNGVKLTSTAAANNAVQIGDYVFTVAAAEGHKSGVNSAIEFTLAGKVDESGNVVKYANAKEVTAEDAAAVNELFGGKVSVEYTAAAATKGSGTQGGALLVHDVINVTQAVGEEGAKYAGIDLEITGDMTKDGTVISIAGKDFTVTYDAYTSPTASNAPQATNAVINLNGFEEGSEEAIHALVDQLSQKDEYADASGDAAETRKFKLSSGGDNVIHIDQTSATVKNEKLEAAKDLQALVSVKGEPVEAANASSVITLNEDNLVEGNTITVDGKSFVFAKDPSSVENGIGVDINNAVADLAAKLGEAGFNATADAEKGTVTIEAKDAESSAPVVLGKGLALQIGDTADDFNQLAVSVEDMHVDALGIGDIDISTQEGASVAIDKIKAAINSVSMTRGTLGATQNRLEHTANNLSVMEENIQDAESSIRDTDIAEEMMAYTKNNILIQSAQAMLAQANTIPQGVLQLLG